MKYVSYGLRALLAIAFIAAGSMKLIGSPDMVVVFEAVGVGQWFRYVTGLIEVGSAIMLWVPGYQAIAAAILGGTMIGATLAHLLILGPSALPAIVLGVLCATVLYLHRSQLATLLKRLSQ